MKTALQFSLIFLACVNGFAPIHSISQTSRLVAESPKQNSKHVTFMSQQILEETRSDEETKSEIQSSVNQTMPDQQLSLEKEDENMSETQNLMQQVKDAGVAGVVSYALWEFAFWTISVPVCVFGYREVTGHWPDFSDAEDIKKLSAEAFAFVNFARFAVPLRIGLALGTTPWIQENIIDRFSKEDATDATSATETEN